MEFTPSLLGYFIAIIGIALSPNPFAVLIYFLMVQSSTTFEQLAAYTFLFAVSSFLAVFRQRVRDDD